MVLKLVQIGLGRLGLTNYGGERAWAGLVKESPLWKSVAYIDNSGDRIQTAIKKFCIPKEKCFPSFDEAVKKVDAYAALIVTPTRTHAPLVIEALNAGLNVLVEKPFTDTLVNAKNCVEKAEKCGLKLMVDQNYRFGKGTRTIKKILKDKIAGVLGYVHLTCAGGYYKETDWRHEESNTYLVNTGIHELDLFRFLTDSDALNVCARRWKPIWSWVKGYPSIAAFFEMENGVSITYVGSCVSMGKSITDWRLECSNGTIHWDGSSGIKTYLQEPGGVLEAVLSPEQSEGYDTIWYEDRFEVLREFAESIIENREPITSGKDNLRSIAMVHAAIEAMETGKLIDIKKPSDM